MIYSQYDIIILGAGISGLVLGSELSKNHSVLIIEKEASSYSDKYWVTLSCCLEKIDKRLHTCIDNYFENMDFISHDSIFHRCHSNYILWDSQKLMDSLKEILLNNKGQILYSHFFYSYEYCNQGIAVKANGKTFYSKILIDCMGFNSPIIYAESIVDIKGYYLLYGTSVKLKKNIDPICLHNICISKNPKYLEVFPKNNGEAYVSLLYPERCINIDTSCEREFNFILNKSPYSQYFDYVPGTKFFSGVVPVGTLRKKALYRVVFYGEAGQTNPSATGTCLNVIFNTYQETALRISDCINTDQYSVRKLKTCVKDIGMLNKKFQLSLYYSVLNWTSSDFSKIASMLQNFDNDLFNDILFGNIQTKSIFNINFINQLLKTRNFFALNLFLKSLI